MTFKLIELSETKAYKVEAIKMEDGSKFLSVRQMYATKADPGNFKPGRQGMTLPWGDEGLNVLREAGKLMKDPETKFKKLKKE
jgi:hypothetical protein